MWALVLEDGRLWGEAAADFQVEDAEAIFADDGPLWHYLTRPRGGSKTTDLAGVALAWLATDATPRKRGWVVASSESQAGELVDAAAGFVTRTPELHGVVQIDTFKMTALESGASVTVMTSDGNSAFGKGRDTGFIILDEFAQLPQTAKIRRLWVAMLTSAHKTPDLRLVILTSAGEPGHFSYDVLREAYADPEGWHVHEVPGPVPWHDPKILERERRHLTDSEYARLLLNRWTESEDRLVTKEDLQAAQVLSGPLPPQPGRQYVIGLDLGLRVDPTVLAVCHGEPVLDPETQTLVGTRVVLDKMLVWQGTRERPVDTMEVERAVLREARLYGARVQVDPWNTAEMCDRLRSHGVICTQYTFSQSSVARLAFVLYNQLRSRLIALPADEALVSELANVRLRETSVPGQRRMDHEPGQHDDRAIALALAAEWIVATPEWDLGDIYAPMAPTALDATTDPWAAAYAPAPTAAQGASADPFAVLHQPRAPEEPSGAHSPAAGSSRRWVAGRLVEAK